jgi:putative intracellular protease/amidase
MRALMIVTSHDRLGKTGDKTGFWLEELVAPYHEFKKNGIEIDIASPLGGEAPVDPRSLTSLSALFTAYLRDRDVAKKFKHATSLSFIEQSGVEYDVCFVVGGHGIMWDGVENQTLQRILARAFEQGHIVAAVCHGPAALVNVRLHNGELLVKGRRVTSFTNEEERDLKLDMHVPFLLESRLRELGANFEKAPAGEPCVVQDGRLLTGQNPASAAGLAQKIMEVLHIPAHT